MNVELVGRLRPPVTDDRISADGSVTANTGNIVADGSNNRLINKLAGNSFTFQQLHISKTSNFDVYQSSVQPLLRSFIDGYNTSLIVTGCKGSGKSYTVAGSSATNMGLFPTVLQQLFSKIERESDVDEDGRGQHSGGAHARSLPQVQMQAFDIDADSVVDLLVGSPSNGSQARKPEVTESAEKGPHVANLTSVQVASSTSGQTLFRQAWARHNPSNTTFIQLELAMMMPDVTVPTKSMFTFVVLPINSKPQVSADAAPAGTQLRRSSGGSADSSKTQGALMQLTASLASQPYPDRVIKYSESTLTRLLQDQLGGNCMTCFIMCFSPFSDPSVTSSLFQLADTLSKVKNFPVINDSLAQQLLIQYRATVLGLRRQLDPSFVGLHSSMDYEQLKNVQAENVMLRDASEDLQERLSSLQDKYSALAMSKADLSTQLLMTEEEKLRVSKAVLDIQIENNRIKEENEAAMFEMSNKVLQMEFALADAKEENRRLTTEAAAAKEKLEDVEKTRKVMEDEFARLKSTNVDLIAAHQKMMERNDNLNVQLMKVLNSYLSALEHSESAARERDYIRDIIGHLADRPAESQKLDKEHQTTDKPVFEAMNRLQQQLNQDVNEFEKEKEKLHTKIADLRNELNDARRQTREIQSKMSELNAQLITARSDKSALESQVNRIQHKLKDVIDDFKSRLAKYVKDIAGYMDKVERRVSNDGSTPARMTQYVEDMLNDMKRLHHTREEQLSAAANTYRQRLEQTVRRHEELLMAYRDLRQQVEARGLTDVELGPDEHNMRLHTEPELASRQQRVIERLRDDLTQKQAELDALKLRMRVGQHGKQQQPDKTNQKLPAVSHSRDSHRDSTTEMQKKMNEFLLDTQKELEQERSRLRAENAMLKEEVKELERYIDNHLGRYADEIRRERKMIEELSTALKSMSHHRQTPVVSHDDFGKSSPRRNNRR